MQNLIRSCALVAVALPAVALSQAVRKDAPPSTAPEWTLPAAPYVSPKVGTRYVYTRNSQLVTRVEGLHTYFEDQRGQLGMLTALFIPDNPDAPLEISDAALRKLWPLRTGNITDVVTRRGDVRNLWRFTVVGAESVSVTAGTFATYRIDGVEQTILTPDPQNVSVNVVSWWYAPSIGAVVKFNTLRAVGAQKGTMRKNELITIEKPRAANPGP